MHKFYPRAHWYMLFAFAVVIVSFIPTYWSRDFGVFSPSVHAHGISASLWFIVLIIQPWLINTRRIRTHRLSGQVSLVIGISVVISAALVIPNMLSRTFAFQNPNIPYMFFYWDIVTTAGFGVFLMLAMIHRRNMQLHARYMIATVFIPMLPAVARGLFFYGIVDTDFLSALYVGSGLILAAISLLLAVDYRKTGQLYTPYVAVFAMLIVLNCTFQIVASSKAWHQLMDTALAPILWTSIIGSLVATWYFSGANLKYKIA